MWVKNVKLDNGDPDMIWVAEPGTADENMHVTKPSSTGGGVTGYIPGSQEIIVSEQEYNRLLDIEQKFLTLKRLIEDDDSLTLTITYGGGIDGL